MSKLITQCPSCHVSEVTIKNIECTSCGTKFEGAFQVPSLLKLSQEDLLFIQEFVKASGSLKEVAARFDISYPTVRNRLNAVIDALDNLEAVATSKRNKILADLEERKINANQAALLLKGI